MEIVCNQAKILGRGQYGNVFEGTLHGKRVAVKRVQTLDVEKNQNDEILKNLKHPNVIKLLHSESDTNFWYYALEYCVANLDQLYLKEGDEKKYKGPQLHPKDILRQLASGIQYIHGENLVHRDLKPENVLVWLADPEQKEQDEQVVIKLADFGLCKRTKESGSFTMSEVKGTRNWLSPELLKLINNDPNNWPRGNNQSDIFAEGLLFAYILLGGKHPYGNKDSIPKNLAKNNGINLKKIPGEYKEWQSEVIDKMLKTNPSERLKAEEVVQKLEELMKTEILKESSIVTSMPSFKSITIENLSPSISADFVLLARLVRKSKVIPPLLMKKSAEKKPRLLMHFKDVTGEIQAVAFGELSSQLCDKLRLGTVYKISNATVTNAYKPPKKNRIYEMQFSPNTKVDKIPDLRNDSRFPIVDVSTTKLRDLDEFKSNKYINIQAVVVHVNDIETVGKGKKKYQKRDIDVKDKSLPEGHTKKLTLWKSEINLVDSSTVGKNIHVTNCTVNRYKKTTSIESSHFTTLKLVIKKDSTNEKLRKGGNKRKVSTVEEEQSPTKKSFSVNKFDKL